MANKQVFTAYDVYGFKKALALHAAKSKALVEKYTLKLADWSHEYECLDEQTPSTERDSWKRVVFARIDLLRGFLKDLETPCDLFISEFEKVCREKNNA